MAKNSAMSKGYRKTIKKKPFLTKKEIIELIVIVAIILLAVVLFNVFYDDGFVKAKDVQPTDIVSYASTDLRDRYKKIGEIGEIEGFTLEERDENAGPIAYHTFTPDAETDNIVSITVSGSFVAADYLADTTITYMQSSLENVPVVQETEIQGHTAYAFAYNYSEYVAPEGEEPVVAEEGEEPAPNKFYQNVSAYIDVNGTHTLCLHIYREGEDDSFYLTDDQVADFVQSYSSAYTLIADAE